MENLYNTSLINNIESSAASECDEEAEPLVVFALRVPRAAKVPAPRHSTAVPHMAVRPQAVASTAVHGAAQQLHLSSTLRCVHWHTTATLQVAARREVKPGH